MGRLSQLFWFLNEEKMPTPDYIKNHYTHLDITPEIKKLRRIRREVKFDERETGKNSSGL